ncbi:MAG: hypothetical protein PHW10_03080 [Candidatus Peribacteraceae bacterium]|nr:hypothetical protein [Candidatus Peribacteraceae bacterium]
MARNYYQLIPHAFKRFSIRSALRTGLPTAWFYLTRPTLPPDDKPALFTMNILPPMVRIWHHLVRKNLGDKVDVTIFDCSGTLRRRDFPGARIQKFLNPRHAMKCDAFLYTVARNRRIAWVCDDDVFIISPAALDTVRRELAQPNTASISFIPRGWWHFRIGEKDYEPSGTYCIAFDRETYVRERLSFAPADGNNHVDHTGGKLRRYDSFDKANETLLEKGYRCAIVPKEERDTYVAEYFGLSAAVMLLSYFRTPEQTLDYLESAPEEGWGGTALPRVLGGLLAIHTIQECYTRLTGSPYPLPSLPTLPLLNAIRRKREPQLRHGQSFAMVDETGEKLKKAL